MKYKIIPVLVISLFLLGCTSWDDAKVCFGRECFVVEIADSYEERTKGLMHRESLDEDKGMLFIFEMSGVYSFWMKNTLIPLDIIWINADKEVVFISHNVQPCYDEPCPSVNPNAGAKYVLELNAGIAEEIGLDVGDKVSFDLMN